MGTIRFILREFTPEDVQRVSSLICRNLREINCHDYPPKIIEQLVQEHTPERILRMSTEGKNVSRRCSRESSWYSSSSSILECKRRVLAAYSLCSTRLPRLRNWPPIGGGRRTVHPTTRGIFCTSLCFSDSSSILSKTRLLRPGEVSRSRRPVSNAKTVVSTVIFCL